MIQPCLNTAPCAPCDSPLANLTSEDPDTQLFVGEGFTDTTRTPYVPPVGHPWTNIGCLGQCVSTVSQADADLCAQNQVALCQNQNNTLFANTAQSCTIYCPDGSPFKYTVAAGIVVLDSQAAADAQAVQFACQQARRFQICLGNIQHTACLNSTYQSKLVATSNFALSFVISSGFLPPGLSLNFQGNTGTITGIPNAAGAFDFSVTAKDQQGNFMTKAYTICVSTIGPDISVLPPAAVGFAYSETFTLSDCAVSPLNWQVFNALPAGMSLNKDTGKLTGTPTTPGSYSITVTVTDSST